MNLQEFNFLHVFFLTFRVNSSALCELIWPKYKRNLFLVSKNGLLDGEYGNRNPGEYQHVQNT